MAVAALAAARCSFTTATGFTECASDAECAASAACVERYCIPLAEGCERHAGAFDAGARLPVVVLTGLLLPDGGRSEREVARLDAMALAMRHANAGGGIPLSSVRPDAGVPALRFTLHVCDTPDVDEVVRERARWAMANLLTPALVVSGSSRMRVLAQDGERLAQGTFLISPNATAAFLTGFHATQGNVWRVAPPDTLQARLLARLMSEAVDGGAAAITYESTDYGSGLAEAVRAELERRSVAVPAFVAFPPGLGAPEASQRMAQVAQAAPAATIIIGFPADVARLAGQASSLPGLGAGHRFFLTDAAKDPQVATVPALAGALGTAPAQSDAGVASLAFAMDFVGEHGVDPGDFSFTGHAHDTMWVVMLAAARAAADGPITGRGMGEAMAALVDGGEPTPLFSSRWPTLAADLIRGRAVDLAGASGPLDFDLDAGAPGSLYELWTVADGGIASLRNVAP